MNRSKLRGCGGKGCLEGSVWRMKVTEGVTQSQSIRVNMAFRKIVKKTMKSMEVMQSLTYTMRVGWMSGIALEFIYRKTKETT